MTQQNVNVNESIHNLADISTSKWYEQYLGALRAELATRAFILQLQAQNDDNLHNMAEEALAHLVDVKDEIANRIASELSGIPIVQEQENTSEQIDRIKKATAGKVVTAEETQEQTA